jgi:type VI secretion system protein ImpL
MMSTITKNLPLILMGIAALVFAAFVIYSFMRADEEEDEDEDELSSTMKMAGGHAADTMEIAETDDLRARKSRMIALKDSLEKSLQTRAGVKASGLDRLAMPWFMLVGTEGSGKKSLLASTGLPLPYGPPVEVDSARKDAGRWWLFEDAVVVEAPTAKSAPKAPAPHEITAATPAVHIDTSEGWNNLLHLLRRERPDSPLNGIIVTVSCADLVGTRRKSPEEMAEQAELLKAFLDKTRRVLGVRLPLHLIITRCDVLPGFRSFAETLPDARRDDIFGWANPAALEKPFDPAAVDAGFVELRKSLEGLHDELLAAPEIVHDADGLFVFVSEFRDVQDPLRDFVTKLMPLGERRPSLFFRGVYFTGDASEFAAKQAKVDDDAATLHISIEATEAESHSLVFLRSLFTDKIFKEAGLARTAARLRISRDLRVLVAQAAAIVIALAGGIGLWTSINGVHRGNKVYAPGLRTGAADLTRSLAGVAIDLDELKRDTRPTGSDTVFQRRATDAAVISLVSELRNVSPNRMRSFFLPSSWFSPIPKEIRASMVDGVQTLVLPVTRLRLQERAGRLLGPHNDVLDASDPKSLVTYLDDVRDLNRNIARYNSLASPDSGTVGQLAALVDYLFGERPFDSTTSSPEFENALKVAQAPRLAVTPAQTAAIVSHAVVLVATIADSASRQLSVRPPSTRVEDDLHALRRLNALVGLTDPKTGLLAAVADSSRLGRSLAKAIQDSINVRLGLAAVLVLKDTLPPDQAGQRLRAVLGAFFLTRLMDESEGNAIADDLRPGQSLRWDIGQLELAFALRGDLKRSVIMSADAFPAQTNARLRAAFESQMRARAIDFVADAQRFTPDSSAIGAEIASATENLAAASTRIMRMAALFDTLKAGAEGKKLIIIGARQAEHVLGLAQTIVDSAKYLAPHPLTVLGWRGGVPIGFAALGVPDTGSFTHRLDLEQIPQMQKLAVAVTPAIAYLRLPAVSAAMITNPKLHAEWKGIVAAAGPEPTTTTLTSLHEYIATTMGAIDIPSCITAAGRADTLSAKTLPDWFVMRRRQFRASMIGRCGKDGGVPAIAEYQKLRAVFVSKLAGHFPFVDSAKAATAPDADPAAVRELYALYDAFAKSGEVALRSDPRVGPAARQAFIFLDQVAAARPFFAPFVDSAVTRKSPEYAFVVEPLKNGANPLAALELRTGTRTLALDDSTHDGVWGFGEAVKVTPAPGATDAKTTFTASGWWGLIELATLQHDVKIKFYHPDTKVELPLPAVFPMVAPDLQPPRAK